MEIKILSKFKKTIYKISQKLYEKKFTLNKRNYKIL